MQVSFYHLGTMPLVKSCGKLLEKVLATGKRAVVLCESEERVRDLNSGLWTFATHSFLPHGTLREGMPERQPIWITTTKENPNGAQILLVLDGAQVDETDPFERCLDIFDGNDPEAVQKARSRWSHYRKRGDTLSYWKQNESGVWVQPEMS